MRTFTQRAEKMNLARLHPEQAGLDKLAFRDLPGLPSQLLVLEQVLLTFVLVLRRLLLLGLCTRVCDAELPSLEVHMRSLEAIVTSKDVKSDVRDHVEWVAGTARLACRRGRGGSLASLVQGLAELCIGMRTVVDHATVSVMNLLFAKATGKAYSVLGSYADTQNRALRYGPHAHGYDAETCSAACSNFKHFALQDNGWCSCDNDLAHAIKYGTEEDCGPRGGRWCNYLYAQAEKRADGVSRLYIFPDVAQRPQMWGTQRREVLRMLLKTMGCDAKSCTMVEVGVFAAETSVYMLDSFPLLRLHGVDPYGAFVDQPSANENVYHVARRLYEPYGDRATLHRGVSRQVAPKIGIVDFVFIDGSHTYEAVVEDISVWAPRSPRLTGHDFNLAMGGVMRAVHEWAAGRRMYLLPDGIWLVDT